MFVFGGSSAFLGLLVGSLLDNEDLMPRVWEHRPPHDTRYPAPRSTNDRLGYTECAPVAPTRGSSPPGVKDRRQSLDCRRIAFSAWVGVWW